MTSFFDELKRRRVVRVAAVYLVAAWGAVQVAATVGPILELPATAARWVLVLAIVGFPIAVALAWRFERTPEGLRRDAGMVSHRAAVRVGFAVLVVASVAASAWIVVRARARARIDLGVLAIGPFRVLSANPDLAVLREGMIEMLATKLAGEVGPRAVDPRALLSAWRREARGDMSVDLEPERARAVARSLGAGRILLGELTSVGPKVTLSATIHDVQTGAVSEPATVENVPDSLPAMVDRLASQLLLRESGTNAHQTAALMSASPRALNAYLAGKNAYRRAAFEEAVRLYERAYQIDTTFALAALGEVEARTWLGQGTVFFNAMERAWRLRNRLTERDRAALEIFTGSNFPKEPSHSDVIDNARKALKLMPDRPEVWFALGDTYFHFSQLIGAADWRVSAEDAFRRAFAIDSTFAPALEHLLELSVLNGDTARVRHLLRQYLALDSTGFIAPFVRWRAAVALGDSATLRSIRELKLHDQTRSRIVGTAQLDGISVGDALQLSDFAYDDMGSRGNDFLTAFVTALNLGKPSRALEVLEAQPWAPQDPDILLPIVEEVRYSGIQDARLEARTEEAARAMLANRPGGAKLLAAARAFGDAEKAYLARGSVNEMRHALPSFQGLPAEDGAFFVDLVRPLFQAMVEAHSGGPGARAAAFRADSLVRRYGAGISEQVIMTARALEAVGEDRAALETLRWRSYHYGPGIAALPMRLREEGRLAAKLGDNEGAVRAYRHYLQLRYDPEPSVKPEVDAVRASLNRLIGESRR